jgi:hypothetical protein
MEFESPANCQGTEKETKNEFEIPAVGQKEAADRVRKTQQTRATASHYSKHAWSLTERKPRKYRMPATKPGELSGRQLAERQRTVRPTGPSQSPKCVALRRKIAELREKLDNMNMLWATEMALNFLMSYYRERVAQKAIQYNERRAIQFVQDFVLEEFDGKEVEEEVMPSKEEVMPVLHPVNQAWLDIEDSQGRQVEDFLPTRARKLILKIRNQPR